MVDDKKIRILIENLQSTDATVRESATEELYRIAENMMDGGYYETAFKIIMDSAQEVIESYHEKKDRKSLKERSEKLAKFETLAQHIYDKMNSDKKKFPVDAATELAFYYVKKRDWKEIEKRIMHDDLCIKRGTARGIKEAAKKGSDITPLITIILDNLGDEDPDVRWRLSEALLISARIFVEHKMEVGDYASALQKIKEVNHQYLVKRKKGLRLKLPAADNKVWFHILSNLTQKIHDKMNMVDNDRKFPLKHQPVRRTHARKVMTNG